MVIILLEWKRIQKYFSHPKKALRAIVCYFPQGSYKRLSSNFRGLYTPINLHSNMSSKIYENFLLRSWVGSPWYHYMDLDLGFVSLVMQIRAFILAHCMVNQPFTMSRPQRPPNKLESILFFWECVKFDFLTNGILCKFWIGLFGKLLSKRINGNYWNSCLLSVLMC